MADQSLPFLFDTGGGISFVSPELAKAAGCTPRGQLVGYRMRGDAIRFPRCEGLALTVDHLTLPPATIGVFDLSKLLPPEWPELGGMIALSSFGERTIAIDLAAREVTVDPLPSGLQSHRINLVRQASGFSVVVLIPVRTEQGTLWLELDSGSSAPLIVAPHAAAMLGVEIGAPEIPDASDAKGPPKASKPIGDVTIALPNVGPVTTPASVADIIYDGNIGAPLMERFVWTLDLAAETVQIAPAHD